MHRVEEKISTDNEFNRLRSQIVTSNNNLNLKPQFATSSLDGRRTKPYTFAEPHIGGAQNNSLEFEGIKSQVWLNRSVKQLEDEERLNARNWKY